jgi:uncharacterized membrane protein YphA (DoxX/SURF4 family)
LNKWSKVFLVALRLAVGWHFLYEGLWKVDSETGTASYDTSWYILQTSVARLRDYYQGERAGGLNADLARADAWYDEIVKAFKARNKALADDQKARLAELRDKVKLAAAARRLPVVDFDWIYVRDEALKQPAPPEPEGFTSLPYLQASAGPFRPLFRGMVNDIDGVERLTLDAAQTSLDTRCREIVEHYQSAGHPFTAEQQARLVAVLDTLKTEIATTLGDPAFRYRLADYRVMRRRAEADTARVTAPFARERLDADRAKMDAIATELLAFVNEPLSELAVQSQAIATVEQLGAGPLPRPAGPARWVDRGIKFSLMAIGSCLLLGLLTPFAAAAGAMQLAVFYLASPPWPGLPAAAVGGHFLYVDRNLIELLAAGVIATTGTGKWAGVDAYLSMWKFRRRLTDAGKQSPVPLLEVETERS